MYIFNKIWEGSSYKTALLVCATPSGYIPRHGGMMYVCERLESEGLVNHRTPHQRSGEVKSFFCTKKGLMVVEAIRTDNHTAAMLLIG